MKKPNIVTTVIATAACKLTRLVLRKTGRGGTAVPGIVAMKICNNILSAASDGMQIVVVTGTNGKTTTCNMIEHALTDAGKDTLLNKSGANMLHGMAADLICNTNWLGRPKQPCAVLECDEAALKLLANDVAIKVIVVTNLFSDQVDRYGGVQNTLKEIRMGVERSPKSVLVLNAEDPLSASLALNVPNRVIWYGMEKSVGQQGKVDLSDAGVCPVCGGDYIYDYHTYAHLGGFDCPQCGYKRHRSDVSVLSIDKMASDGSTVTMKAGKEKRQVFIALPAVYNVYNAAAAVAAAGAMGVAPADSMQSLSSVRSSFGRLETFDLNGNRVQMILVKNPAGCNQAFSYLTSLGEDFTAVLCLNNRTGDGHDISWIEDTDYEKLAADPHLKKLYICGDRMDDLYERLVRAGADETLMEKSTDYHKLVDLLKEEKHPVFLLPNYTSMMELRDALLPETGNKDFWE